MSVSMSGDSVGEGQCQSVSGSVSWSVSVSVPGSEVRVNLKLGQQSELYTAPINRCMYEQA